MFYLGRGVLGNLVSFGYGLNLEVLLRLIKICKDGLVFRFWIIEKSGVEKNVNCLGFVGRLERCRTDIFRVIIIFV